MGQAALLPSPEDGNYEPLSGTAQAVLWGTTAVFALQAGVHWFRATCASSNARLVQHELLSGASTGVSSLLYLGMASGISAALSDVSSSSGAPGRHRLFFHLLYVERAIAPSLLLLNVASLA
ncbi:unnamed protein product, partial [Polarella glacialis]